MKFKICSLLLFAMAILSGCSSPGVKNDHVRQPVDTVGFAQYAQQMDDFMEQLAARFGERIDSMIKGTGIGKQDAWKAVICPHDDYAYAGFMYPAALNNMKARTVILIGVAHKAKLLGLEDQLIFDSYDAWKEPYGDVPVADFRDELIERLPKQTFQVNDSMHRMEHSLEALIPFLQYRHRDLEIVPLLVPYMPFEKMNTLAIPLAEAIRDIAAERNWSWGKDFAIVISNDAVHYGDEGWGEKNYARYGTDTQGYRKAVEHEQEIIRTISGPIGQRNIEQFCRYTVVDTNYREYKWPWCGRYSVPLGLLTAFHLNHLFRDKPLTGYPIGYATSIDHEMLDVEGLGMGITAPANRRHWVGYAAIGYR